MPRQIRIFRPRSLSALCADLCVLRVFVFIPSEFRVFRPFAFSRSQSVGRKNPPGRLTPSCHGAKLTVRVEGAEVLMELAQVGPLALGRHSSPWGN